MPHQTQKVTCPTVNVFWAKQFGSADTSLKHHKQTCINRLKATTHIIQKMKPSLVGLYVV